MATYQIEWKASAFHELKAIDRQIILRIVSAIGLLAADPFPPGVRKLRGSENTYRLRVGDYRVLYEVHSSSVRILIVRVRHRKDVYRR
jgi:mRNA interferase RelE/StbE